MSKFSAGGGDSPVRKTLWCTIFGFTWSTIVVFMILQKPHVLGKSFSSYIQKCSRPIRLQDFLSFNIKKIIWGIKFLFFFIFKCSWKLQFNHAIFFGFSQACLKCSEKKTAIQILMKDLVHRCGFLILNDAPPLRISKIDMDVKNLVLEL